MRPRRSLVFALALALQPDGGAAAQGLRFEPEAEYAAFPRIEGYRAFLPVRVDLSARFPAAGDQGRQGSAVAWAVAYARASYATMREASRLNNPVDIPSPAYIYAIAKPAGGCETGMTIAAALALLQREGAPSLAQFPYAPDRCSAPDSRAAKPGAFRIAGWRTLDVKRLDDVKGALAQGHPVIAGLLIGDEFHKLRGEGAWTGGGRSDEGHALVLVGYDEARQALKLINSWGSDWGKGGFGWIGYAAFTRLARRAYVIDTGGSDPGRAITRGFGSGQPADVRPAMSEQTASAALDSYSCGDLKAVQSEGTQVVRGFVGSAEDLARLKASAARGGMRVEALLRPWPQCEILLTLREALAAAGAPVLRLRGDRSEFRDGDLLVVELTTADRPSYLYLAYVSASGEVAYLLQPQGLASSPYPPRQKLVFGDGSQGRARFTVTAPFGEDMVVAIAADSPLFDAPRPRTETAREFLTVLRRVLLERPSADAQRRKLAAAWLVLRTREK